MKKLLLVVLVVLLAVLPTAVSAEPDQGSGQADFSDQIIYLVMTDRFYNGDTTNDTPGDPNNPRLFHGGDLEGVIQKLDYLKDLGVTAIWLTPIVQNDPGGYHGYWANDFYKIDSHFGDMQTLQKLVAEAHARNIKILLDVVVNHTGPKNPMVIDPAKKDWFHHFGDITDWNNQEEIETHTLSGLPDFAQENPEVRQYLMDMAVFWADTGVDGFRLDTMRHVPKDFWEEFAAKIHEKHPGFYLIGEAWNENRDYVAQYQKVGIDGMVDFPMRKATDYFIGNAVGELPSLFDQLKMADTAYPRPNQMGHFIDNHDVPRFVTAFKDTDLTKVRQALAWTLTTPGVPILYYGTEQGMTGGADPDNRHDMQFDNNPALYQFTQALNLMRADHPAVRHGEPALVYGDNDTMVYSMTKDDDVVLVAMYNGGQAHEVTANLAGSQKLYPVVETGLTVKQNGSQLKISFSGSGVGVYTLKKAQYAVADPQAAASVSPAMKYWPLWLLVGLVIGFAGSTWMRKRRR